MKAILLPTLLVMAGVTACSSGSSGTASPSPTSASPSAVLLTAAETCTLVDGSILDTDLPNQAQAKVAVGKLQSIVAQVGPQIQAQVIALESAIQVAAGIPNGAKGMSSKELAALGDAVDAFAVACKTAGVDLG